MAKPKRKTRRAAGDGYVKRLGTGYQAGYPVGKLPSGRPRYITRRFRAEADAEAQRAAWQQQHTHGQRLADGRQTTEAFLNAWLHEQRTRRREPLQPTTIRDYELLIGYITGIIGDLPIADVTRADTDRVIAAWVGVLASSTVARIGRVMTRAFQAAVKDRLRLDNPADDLDIPKPTTRRAVTLTPAAVRQLRANLEDHPLRMIYELLLLGLRAGEALAVQIADLDLDAATLTIQRQQTAPHQAARAPKRGSVRTIPLPAALVADLRSWIDARIDQAQARGQFPRYLTATANETPISYRNLTRSWVGMTPPKSRNAETRHGVYRGVRPIVTHLHDLRHTASSALLALGCPAELRSALLGHSAKSVTEHYSRGERIAALRPWIESLWDWYSGSESRANLHAMDR